MVEAILENIKQEEVLALFGSRDENLRMLRDVLGLKVVARNGTINLQGPKEQVDLGLKILDRMRAKFRSNEQLSPEDVTSYIRGTLDESDGASAPSSAQLRGPMRSIRARSPGQHRYIEQMSRAELTLCIGPAGTGKTYLAVAAALEALHARRIKRIVLVRPAVEAGERLGYLPGDLQAKVHPFLTPLLDALRDMLDFHQVRSFLENDVIEIAPLAYMRGRTLNEAYIILDEGQNTTIPQMKMFLTRMGMGSRIVVTGDVTQVDLPKGVLNGLDDAINRLGSLTRVAIVRMENRDIVRHPLVQAIVDAYDAPDSDGPPEDKNAGGEVE